MGTVKPEIVVKGDAPIVSTTTKDISGLVGEEAIKDLQFRAEIFNLLNRANFNTLNLIVFTPATTSNPSGPSGTVGAITSSTTSSRQVTEAALLASEPPLARGSL